MKIVFTSSYKTFSKENSKNYTPNSYVLVFLISVIFFFAYNLGRREYHLIDTEQKYYLCAMTMTLLLDEESLLTDRRTPYM